MIKTISSLKRNGPRRGSSASIRSQIKTFRDFGKQTICKEFPDSSIRIPVYVNEFWTSKQRAAHSLHEVSYRACFKPQLPRFFIERLTKAGDRVYDPFMGRGTTLLEAAMLGRIPVGCDINPLSSILLQPRFRPPELSAISRRLEKIDLEKPCKIWKELLVFYHPKTLQAVTNLRNYLLRRTADGKVDEIDEWIRMVATNRLTGHSPGFFSVYTLPPNQAVSLDSQRRINKARQQQPPKRDVRAIILRKSRSLLSQFTDADQKTMRTASRRALLLTGSSTSTKRIRSGSIQLVVTSPPFLDTVDYRQDNWLRCWFNGINSRSVPIWQLRREREWQDKMAAVFRELARVLRPGGHIAFEVGEVRKGKMLLETLVVPAASTVGLRPLMVLVNSQNFTKTSNCWGVSNAAKGTNTNRIVLLQKSK